MWARNCPRLSRDQRREVEDLGRRYGVSLQHARKVADICSLLFTALQPLHGLPPGCGKLLEAAAFLHDVGHFVSAVGHHKHSYYVVSNSDMAGFTDRGAHHDRRALPVSSQVAAQSAAQPVPALSPEERNTVLI